VGNEGMTAGEIDDAPPAKPSSCSARDLPRLEELLARKAVGAADDACNPMKKGVVLEVGKGTRGQLGATGSVVAHAWPKCRAISAICPRRRPARPERSLGEAAPILVTKSSRVPTLPWANTRAAWRRSRRAGGKYPPPLAKSDVAYLPHEQTTSVSRANAAHRS
jgi:hypothetical protein